MRISSLGRNAAGIAMTDVTEFTKRSANIPTRNQLKKVPRPMRCLPKIISTTNHRQLKMSSMTEKVMPSFAPTAITIALEGSFPKPDNLNMPIPTPRIMFPIIMKISLRGLNLPLFILPSSPTDADSAG